MTISDPVALVWLVVISFLVSLFLVLRITESVLDRIDKARQERMRKHGS